MKKSVVIIGFILITIVSVIAVQFANANTSNDKSLYYLYTPECRACKHFESIYQQLNTKFRNKCKFIKVNANTQEGAVLMHQFKGTYVPFVVLANNSTKKYYKVHYECAAYYACAEKVIEDFLQ